ncbi:MAG: radical SAM protein [Desulfarculaceae bacterium]|jgi:radical SAM protein with 4Fe4S-binding SPASM domain
MGFSQEQKDFLTEVEQGIEDHLFPPQLVIETTSRCNMKCLHCSHKEMQRTRADMDEGLFKKIVEEVAREMPDCEIWPTFYGEALLLGDKLWRLLDYADRVGCRYQVLNSNGIMLSRPGMIEAVLDSPLKRFILSLDGFSKETFEKIRVGGNRDKIFTAVENLLKERARRGQMHPVIQCQFSIMEENQHEVEQYSRYWLERGAEVKTRRKLSWTSTGTIEAPELIRGDDFRICCPWGSNAAAIHQNGDLVTCAVDYEGRFVAGNVGQMSIKEIWQGPHSKLVREPHHRHQWNKLPEICQNCPDWQAVGAHYHGDKGKEEGARPFWHQEGKA